MLVMERGTVIEGKPWKNSVRGNPSLLATPDQCGSPISHPYSAESDESDEDEVLATFHDEFHTRLARVTKETILAGMKERQRELQLTFRSGRFTKAENKQLHKNMMRVCATMGIDDPALIFTSKHLIKKVSERKEFKRQLKRMNVNRMIIKSIWRPCYQIFLVAEGRYGLFCNEHGGFTDEQKETAKLFLQTDRSRGDRLAIAKLVGRSTYDVHDYLSKLSDKKGAWSRKEDRKLIKAVKRIMGTEDVNDLYQGLPFVKIAKLVPTRSAIQCSMRWRLSLCGNIVNNKAEGRPHLKKKDKVKLIKLVYNQGVSEYLDLDWDDIASHFDRVGPAAIREVYLKMVRTKAPGFRGLSHSEIIDHLYRVYRRSLKKQLLGLT